MRAKAHVEAGPGLVDLGAFGMISRFFRWAPRAREGELRAERPPPEESQRGAGPQARF